MLGKEQLVHDEFNYFCQLSGSLIEWAYTNPSHGLLPSIYYFIFIIKPAYICWNCPKKKCFATANFFILYEKKFHNQNVQRKIIFWAISHFRCTLFSIFKFHLKNKKFSMFFSLGITVWYVSKVQIFWEGHTIWQNLNPYRSFDTTK